MGALMLKKTFFLVRIGLRLDPPQMRSKIIKIRRKICAFWLFLSHIGLINLILDQVAIFLLSFLYTVKKNVRTVDKHTVIAGLWSTFYLVSRPVSK